MLDANAFGLIELMGVFALLLGALGWQWVSIRRTLREDREKAERSDAEASDPQQSSRPKCRDPETPTRQ